LRMWTMNEIDTLSNIQKCGQKQTEMEIV